MLRNIIKPESNPNITEDLYKTTDENLGRIDENIDKFQKEAGLKIDVESTLEVSKITEIKIKQFQNFLIESEESIVINPIINSLKTFDSFKEEDKTKKKTIRKDIRLFGFYLMKEMYPASQSVGGFTRQEIKAFPKNIKLFSSTPESSKSDMGEELKKMDEFYDPLFDGSLEEEEDEYF